MKKFIVAALFGLALAVLLHVSPAAGVARDTRAAERNSVDEDESYEDYQDNPR